MTRSFTVAAPHELIWVRGPDAVVFLDGLLSQSVASIAPGTVRRSLLLTPRGKLDAPLWLLGGERDVGVVVEAGFAQSTAAGLARFKIRVDATVAVDERRLTEVWGSDAADLAAAGTWEASPAFAADLPLLNGPMRRVLTTAEVTVAAASEDEAEAVRIAMGEPRLGVDIGEDTIPQEAGLVAGAVDFDKGCYLGQELVARIESRGRVNRQLRGMRSLGPPLAAPSAVKQAGSEVGMATSAAIHPDLGGIALGMLRREVEVGDEVELGAVPAVVTDLPIPPAPHP
ncbi:MAG: folate-binding protein [Actinobacteria bacterium]|nr:MAG: folate-binding protein [Actinomycetota bacterium]